MDNRWRFGENTLVEERRFSAASGICTYRASAPVVVLRPEAGRRNPKAAFLRSRSGHVNPTCIHRDVPLNLHLNRRAHIELQFRTMLQQSPRHAACDPGQTAIEIG